MFLVKINTNIKLLVEGLAFERGDWGLVVFAQNESKQSESWHPILTL